MAKGTCAGYRDDVGPMAVRSWGGVVVKEKLVRLGGAFTLVVAGAVMAGVSSMGAGAANAHANYAAVCAGVPAGSARCDAMVVTDSQGNPSASSTPAAGAYGPAQFHTAYALPTTSSSAQTIGIVDAYNDPNVASDLATYDSYYGLPSCTVANGCLSVVSQTGTSKLPKSNSGWSLEISLDVQTAHEICQNCKILLVEANSNSMANLGASVNEAVKLGANVVSNSYGSSEYSGEVADSSSYFNHPGTMITVSAGDGGYGVEFPAASQYVTAVGGTTLYLNADNTYQSEAAWAKTGSGCSAYIAKPTWQLDTGCASRTVGDVSADADPATGAAVYDSVRYQGQSGWFTVGGTSLSSPLVGATYALAGNASALNYGSNAYANTASLHDVTTGSNGTCSPPYLCTAQVGYDAPTGNGSPNGLGAF